ncbi:MAG: 1-deoxy-D-xylulose-5-phosphate synthase [Pseudomonadota bacterium]|nr:1-deoxy-D-xylulose-5-phosphate synthase [Pseudomonadota bacterium]
MKIFDQFPEHLRALPLLDAIERPKDFRHYSLAQLKQLSDELREYILYSVHQSGGHFGANLGVVELTVVLHYLYNTPYDRLVWDVGHQTYPHKVLTGRRDQLLNIRQSGGLSGFPKRSESEYDTFGVGHSSTSISAALGMAVAAQMKGENRKSVAIIGDGAMTGGMAFEAMHHAADTKANMLVILNDNNMSISRNVGGLANYFARVWSSKLYISMREEGKRALSMMPPALKLARRTEASMKNLVSPDALFEAIGFNYVGPINGHDIEELLTTIGNMKNLSGPQLLHIYTTKGKGFRPAEGNPIKYHALGKIAPKQTDSSATTADDQAIAAPPKAQPMKFQDVFGQWLCDTAEQDSALVAITPAMCEGSGMVEFAKRFPKQFHDVAIAEQHAVTFAAGLACETDTKPVVAIYSTFLQRGYDQLVHDVCLQDLDVLFAIDRAGVVGEDGATHAGIYDYAYMRCLPNLVIMAPSDENECRQMLWTGYQHTGAAAVRYPRGTGIGAEQIEAMDALELGRSVTRRTSGKTKDRVCIFAFGTLLHEALKAAEQLDATVIDMRFVKPIDEQAILQAADEHKLLVSLEDHVIQGGANAAISEVLHAHGKANPLLVLGVGDEVLKHGTRNEILAKYDLNAEGILNKIISYS